MSTEWKIDRQDREMEHRKGSTRSMKLERNVNFEKQWSSGALEEREGVMKKV